MNSLTRRKFTVIQAKAILTTEDGGGDAGAGDNDNTDTGTSDASTTGGEGDDLTTLFTPEDIQAKKDLVAANVAEETRRAALTDEQRAVEDQAKTEEAAKNSAPEKYSDFTAPEGVVLDPEMAAEFAATAKALNLPQDKAQQLVDIGAKMIQKQMDGIFAAHEQRKESWLEAAKSDSEIGADVKLWDDKNPESTGKSVALRAFNSIAATVPGIKQMVDELGIGNHPEFIRVFYRLGQNMREDTFVIPGGGGGGESTTIAKTLWPGMK